MKKYTVQPNEDLGLITHKFGIPSWRYLYKLNKAKIGDNPDLLKPGTVLDMPDLDSTMGDEKLEKKGIVPEMWLGGVGYRYPWVPYSRTLADFREGLYTEKNAKNEQSSAFDKKKKYKIYNAKTRQVIAEGEIGTADELETLIPDAENTYLEVDGTIYA